MRTPRDRLKAWRKDLDISQEKLAGELGCSQVLVSLIESGHRRPGLAVATAIERLSAAWRWGPIRASEWLTADLVSDGDGADEAEEDAA